MKSGTFILSFYTADLSFKMRRVNLAKGIKIIEMSQGMSQRENRDGTWDIQKSCPIYSEKSADVGSILDMKTKLVDLQN